MEKLIVPNIILILHVGKHLTSDFLVPGQDTHNMRIVFRGDWGKKFSTLTNPGNNKSL